MARWAAGRKSSATLEYPGPLLCKAHRGLQIWRELDSLPPPAGGRGGQMKGCKNCPAYAKCTVTYRGSACAALRGTYGLDSDPEIITNADRIRAMSDDELLDFMKKSVANAYMCKIMRTEPMFLTLAWLQKPAEEDGQ